MTPIDIVLIALLGHLLILAIGETLAVLIGAGEVTLIDRVVETRNQTIPDLLQRATRPFLRTILARQLILFFTSKLVSLSFWRAFIASHMDGCIFRVVTTEAVVAKISQRLVYVILILVIEEVLLLILFFFLQFIILLKDEEIAVIVLIYPVVWARRTF